MRGASKLPNGASRANGRFRLASLSTGAAGVGAGAGRRWRSPYASIVSYQAFTQAT